MKANIVGAVVAWCAVSVAPAQTFTVIANLSGAGSAGGGAWTLVQGLDGNFYGTTQVAGGPCEFNSLFTCGTVFKVTPAGKVSVIHDFCQGTCTDGGNPLAGLILANNGNFYGTTSAGANCCGTAFEITPKGAVTVVHTFSGYYSDGYADGPLMQGANGDFYGAAMGAGANGYGGLFQLTAAGTFTMLYTFSGPDGSEGSYHVPGLTQAANGDFYGATPYGPVTSSSNGCGTIFQLTPGGTLTTLFSFNSNGSNGCTPYGTLAATPQGFYGTTFGGGAANYGTVFNAMTGAIYNFCSQPNCADGLEPFAGLILGTDGNLYGTTTSGGASGLCGTVFQITPGGMLATLHSFTGSDGCYPYAGLVQGTDGNFYGATTSGGSENNGGTVFRVSMGLHPFVRLLPGAGKTGAEVRIYGNNLTGTTSVTFNGTAATFTVTSATLITATVPSGATTGIVTVVTPGGTLSSNTAFRVRP